MVDETSTLPSDRAMRVLSMQPMPESLRLDGRSTPFAHVTPSYDPLTEINSFKPNVLVVGPGQLSDSTVKAFAGSCVSSWSTIVTHDPAHTEDASQIGAGMPDGMSFIADTNQEYALKVVERTFTKKVTFAATAALIEDRPSASRNRSVLLVGAGIVNLMTALKLSLAGYRVSVVDRSPSPIDRGHWRDYGCSHGGQDARMFSITEYDNYNEKNGSIYTNMSEVFSRPLADGGWLALEPDDISLEERSWNEMFQRLPAWLARGYTEEIYEVGAQARAEWLALFQKLPSLREGIGYREGVLRTYEDPVKLEKSRQLQQDLGALERVLSADELARRYPAFRDACSRGTIIGGLEIRGFTVQLHALVRQLVFTLEARGVSMTWNVHADGFDRDTDGRIIALRSSNHRFAADDYVISPGVYGHGLLRDFESRTLLHGVLGAWITLPRIDGSLARSVKIKRTANINEDINVTVAHDPAGKPLLILGSGYGYVGSRPDRLSQTQLGLMHGEMERIAASYFPTEYELAKSSGMLASSKSYCVRPWTPSGLGVFEVQAAKRGLAIVTGGHNTGGFAVSPAVASAVHSALEGQVQDMHWRFHPHRLIATLPALHRFLP